MPKAHAPPAVADNDALKLVQNAAKAVGMDVETLANLMVDSGVTALPASDGITGRYTLEDLGKRLWGELQQQPRTERGKWFRARTEPQRVAVIVVLRDRGYASTVIAKELELQPMEVVRVWNKHAADLGAQVVGLRLDTIAGQLQAVKERAQQVAMEKGDAATMWRVEKDYLAALQSLGVVDRAIHKVEHTVKFDDQQRAEIEAMLELERKKEQRGEEIKQIEASVIDPVPEMEDYDDA